MSSRRRSRSRDKKILPAKLRMDTKPQAVRITDPSLPAGRRREIDNVMKKARAQKSPNSGVFWDKKLLEVEAKDPNRWRHSGYKSLYIDGGGSSSPSSGDKRSRSRSPTSPLRPPLPRSPPMRRSSPYGRARSPRSPRSPPPRSSRSSSPPPRRRSPPGSYRSPVVGGGRRSPPPSSARSSRPLMRPRSPREPPSSRHNVKRRSISNSSISSCSDDSCSVCSPKAHRNARSRSRSLSPKRVRKPPVKVAPNPPKPRARPRPPSPSPPRRIAKPTTPPPASRRLPKPSPSDRPTDPRRQPPPPRPRGSTGEIINVRGVKPNAKFGAVKKPADKNTLQPMLLKRVKKERTAKRPGSPGVESSGSEDSASQIPAPIVATTSLTLSERFGKIAQWSADREKRDMENMRITKTGSNMKVLVEEDEFLYGSSPRRYSLSPVPSGHFPDKLMSSSQSRTAAWDDVRVRYQYYKDLGYLRDLTLDDYVKWEEWWYKYQDWLANERHYEHWLSTQGGGRRRGKKRIPATQRLN
ncbi:LOW QUALITY PROTEIN: uncharacterized protein [Leptinotarsa decemlineata]|uniref:LOW QUALITY PROTEIN: uncharacterized protein n=1 Tax=Leptinotarsa decemlineata TaxID=7539 RepID=UPI003D309852